MSDLEILLSVQFDFLAGTSVAALVVPQGMSYAKSAGMLPHALPCVLHCSSACSACA